MAKDYDEMKLEPIDGRGMELDLVPMANMELELGSLGVTPAQYAALDARVQANTDAVGVLDDRIVTAEAEIGQRYTKTETDGLLGAKADKQQEDWITPTLLNGWVSPTEIKYYKDDLGIVRISGRVSGEGTTGPAFNLPVGYRPIFSRQFPVLANSSFASFMIETNGNAVWIGGGSKVNVNLDAITFKAER